MKLKKTRNDPNPEVLLKNILCICMLALFFLGCSASKPTVSDESISSENAVTGQRILAQVYAISDNPPMTYQWSASGGTMEATDESSYAAYWIAPEEPGTYTITCLISDEADEHASRSFTVQVSDRALETLVGPGKVVLTLSKQIDSRLGGIWATIQDDYIRYFSSRSDADTTWKKNFTTMIARITDLTTFDYTIWGVDAPGKNIAVLTSTSESTLECTTCEDADVISTLSLDVLDSNILWVGADSGLHAYNSTNTTTPWVAYISGKKFTDLFEGSDYTYAASDSGIFKLTGLAADKTTPLYDGDTCAVCAVDNGDTPATVTIWAVVDGMVEKNGEPLALQPDYVACSIDVDPSGNIWCGKYWWDGTTWQSLADLNLVIIVKSVASNEGLIYLLSDSGVLYRW